jgi:hypothetical protein
MPVFAAERAAKASRPAGRTRPAAVSSAIRATLIALQVLRALRGVNRMV